MTESGRQRPTQPWPTRELDASAARATCRRFDWDGQIAPLRPKSRRSIEPHYAPHLRDLLAALSRRIPRPRTSAHYYTPDAARAARSRPAPPICAPNSSTRFDRELDGAWRAPCAPIGPAGVPLAPLLVVAERRASGDAHRPRRDACGADSARLARYADVVQRLSLVEAHLLIQLRLAIDRTPRATSAAGELGRNSANRSPQSIDGTAALGKRIRVQAGAHVAPRPRA